jgi:hypothetical protein
VDSPAGVSVADGIQIAWFETVLVDVVGGTEFGQEEVRG